MTSLKPTFLFLALLTSCVSPNPQPALQAQALQRAVFVRTMDGHEALIRRSNPPQATLDAYLAQAHNDRDAFDRAYQAANAAIGSIGNVDPQQINALIDQIAPLIDHRLPPAPPAAQPPAGGGR